MRPVTDRLHVLFVCSRNAWRSPTAERLWRDEPLVATRSAGTSPRARHTVSSRDLIWADVILAMETRHRDVLRERFGATGRAADVRVLHVPDDYRYMDPELVALLEAAVPAALRDLAAL